MKSLKQESGFAMIEVLLAVVVLAIGLLAGSKMQMLGLNYTQGAMMRSHATMAINDIIDRMRINPTGVNQGAYDSKNTDSPPANPNCPAIGCTPAQLADLDLRVFAGYFGKADATDVSTAISGATGTISAPNASGIRTIEVIWEELVEGDAEERKITIGVFL